ncbi:MAG: DUF4321 domain-containing protein [Fibrobacter sp.]|nr:DUF4321 domain-containing protein [Fibrobacter sp.]
MRQSKSSVGRLIVFIILGLVLGGILGETFGLILGKVGELTHAGFENNIRSVFVGWFLDLGVANHKPIVIDLYMIKFTLGLGVRFNVASIFGVFLSLYIMKWSGN